MPQRILTYFIIYTSFAALPINKVNAASAEFFTSHTAAVTDVNFVPSGDGSPRALSISDRGDVICWNVSTKKIIWQNQLEDQKAEYGTTKVSPTGQFFIPLRNRLAPKIHLVSTGKVAQELKLPPNYAGTWWVHAAFSLDERFIALASATGEVIVYNLDHESILSIVQPSQSQHNYPHAAMINFSKDGRYLTVIDLFHIKLYNLNSLDIAFSVNLAQFGIVTYASFSNDLRLLAIANDRTVYIVDTQTLKTIYAVQKPTQGYEHGLMTQLIQFEETDSSHHIHVWNASMDSPWPGLYQIINSITGAVEQAKPINDPIFTPQLTTEFYIVLAAYSPQSKLLLTGSEDPKRIAIWQL